MSILNNNLDYLKQYIPNIKKLYEAANFENIEISQSKSNNLNISLNNIYAHSNYNPINEAEKLNNTIEENNDTIFIFGAGLFYLVEKILSTNTNIKLIIIEPNINLFLKTLDIIDIRVIFSSRQVEFNIADNETDFRNIIAKSQSFNFKVFISNIYKTSYKSIVENFKEIIQLYKDSETVNKNTLNKFGEKAIRNISNNIRNINNYSNINYLKNILNDKEIIIAAAGPTLDNFIKSYKQNMIILCVDTALSTLIKNNIIPDFVIAGDMQLVNSEHFRFNETSNISLITSLTVDYNITTKKFQNIFIYQSNFFLEKNISKLTSNFDYIGSGGTVTSTALEIALYCNCKKIYLAGLDLSYPFEKTHCSFGSFERNVMNNSNRLKTSENYNYNIINSELHETTKNYYDEIINSDKRLLLYKKWFENKAQTNKNIYSLTPNSIKIENINLSKIGKNSKKIALNNRYKTENFDYNIFKNYISDQIKNKNNILFHHKKYILNESTENNDIKNCCLLFYKSLIKN